MRQRIRIESRVPTRTADGGEAVAWSELYSTWAEFSERQPGERFRDGREITTAVGMFHLRYRTDWALNTQQRVLYSGEVWEILRIENVRGANARILLHCALKSEDTPTPSIGAAALAGVGAFGGGALG